MTDKQGQVLDGWDDDIGGLEAEPNADAPKKDAKAEEQPKQEPVIDDEPIIGETQQAEPQEPEPKADEPELRDYDAEARAMGWSPEKGDKSAQEFVEYGEKHKPKNYANKEIDELKQQLEETKRQGERLAQTQATIFKREQERIKADYAQRIIDASEVGDVKAVKAAMTERDAAMDAHDKVQQPAQQQQTIAPEFITWRAEQGFDGWDAGKRAYAIATLDGLISQNPGVNQVDLIPALTATLDRQFKPQPAPRQQPRNITDNGGRPSRNAAPKNGFATLPGEAQRAYKEILQHGIKMSKDDYAKTYYAENAQ